MTLPVVSHLAELVAFPTISDRGLLPMADWLAERFSALGFRVERFPDPGHPGKCSLIMTAGPDRDDESGLMLSGHMDVVPTEGQPWSSDPFRLTERDGRLFGRGSADMKGFFAAALAACAAHDLRSLRAPLVLAWTHDEEVGCLGSAQLCGHLAGRPLPRATWIGEPTDFATLRMHPGHVGAEIVIEGRAAHSSRPHLGLNAIQGAAQVVQALAGLERDLDTEVDDGRLHPRVPINVANIVGGGALNIVPDACTVRIGFRPPPGVESSAIFEAIERRLAELRWPAPLRARVLRVTPSLLTPLGTDLEAWLAPSSIGGGAHDGLATFATDGGNLARLGVQPLVFGPGSIEVAHQADEYVALDALARTPAIIRSVIARACT